METAARPADERLRWLRGWTERETVAHCGKVVNNGTLDDPLLPLVLEGSTWSEWDIPEVSDKMRLHCSAVVHRDLLFVLGGSSVETAFGDACGRHDVCFDLAARRRMSMPQRPVWQRFCRTKTAVVGRFLVCWNVADLCANLSKDRREWILPIAPASCCNQLMFLDMEAGANKCWWPLPCLSSLHAGSAVSFYVQGTCLHLEGGSSLRLGCSCCGLMYEPNTNHFYLDLSELPGKPYWRFWTDE